LRSSHWLVCRLTQIASPVAFHLKHWPGNLVKLKPLTASKFKWNCPCPLGEALDREESYDFLHGSPRLHVWIAQLNLNLTTMLQCCHNLKIKKWSLATTLNAKSAMFLAFHQPWPSPTVKCASCCNHMEEPVGAAQFGQSSSLITLISGGQM